MTDELRTGERIEWAILQAPPIGYPGEPKVIHLCADEEEADAYLAAFEMTHRRRERERIAAPMASPPGSPPLKAWRTVGAWSPPEIPRPE